MKHILFLILFILFQKTLLATIIIVDINGSGSFTQIQPGINAAATGDTVKVLPGSYNNALNMNKNVVLMGSGYETTIITSSNNPTITMSTGKIMWFTISSLTGSGVLLSAGTVTNCVVRGCSSFGVYCPNGSTGIVANCVCYGNGNRGIHGQDGCYASVYNCISYNNGSDGFAQLNLQYSCGPAWYTCGNIGVINLNPGFPSETDYSISSTSPCWDTGSPNLTDPDGSRSDMGYFGGPDAPIYPVVINIRISPEGNGVRIKATGKANW
jgi:hypothetical protein